MHRISPRVLICTLVLLAASQAPAHAQLAWTAYGVGEFDTSDVIFLLGGVSVAPARSGWVPVAGVSASWLQYPTGSLVGEDTRNITTITPTLGIANNFNGGSFQVRVGYAFASGDEDEGAPIVAGEVGQDGVVTAAQLDYWGNGGWGAQAIGSYNFGAGAFWGRGRLTQRVLGLGNDGHIRIGGEVAYMTHNDYNATQVGGVLGFHPGRTAILTAGVGRKFADGDDATYFRLEVVLIPR